MQKCQTHLTIFPEEQTEPPPHNAVWKQPEICKRLWSFIGNSCLQQALEIPLSPRKNYTIGHFKGDIERRKDAWENICLYFFSDEVE